MAAGVQPAGGRRPAALRPTVESAYRMQPGRPGFQIRSPLRSGDQESACRKALPLPGRRIVASWRAIIKGDRRRSYIYIYIYNVLRIEAPTVAPNY